MPPVFKGCRLFLARILLNALLAGRSETAPRVGGRPQGGVLGREGELSSPSLGDEFSGKKRGMANRIVAHYNSGETRKGRLQSLTLQYVCAIRTCFRVLLV